MKDDGEVGGEDGDEGGFDLWQTDGQTFVIVESLLRLKNFLKFHTF